MWDNSNDKDKVSSTSKENVQYMGKNVDVDDRHTDRHADTYTWSNVVSRDTIGGRNVQPR